jgi:hypothetical protein
MCKDLPPLEHTNSSSNHHHQNPKLPSVESLIQMDISGHPPFPTGSKQFSENFGNLLFLAGLASEAILRA